MKYPATRALYAYWDKLRAGRAAPDRSEIDPGAIRTLLGDVFLLDLAGHDRQLVRLAGTRICTLLGRELRDRPFAEVFAAEDWPPLFELLETVAQTASPAVVDISGETRDGRTLDLEMLVLPVRHRGRTTARVLGCLSAEEWPYWAGAMALTRLRILSVLHLRPLPADDIDLVNSPARTAAGNLRILQGGRR